jgi:2-polyprenyl-3-methyl-5-hydroxy-6-metoxy-1,4-benzoquinol methylase
MTNEIREKKEVRTGLWRTRRFRERVFKFVAAFGAALALTVPDEAEQQQFWNEWNTKYRRAEKVAALDYATLRRRDTVLDWLTELRLNRPRILDVGCSTGWLSAQLAQFGPTTGTDLSDSSIREARDRFPNVAFECGNFLRMAPPSTPYDVVVSVDVLSCVADQRAFVKRLAESIRPGGYLLLTTPNRFVLERRTNVDPQGAGQIRQWQTRAEVRRLLRDEFVVHRLTTLAPGGDKGVLRVVNSRMLSGILNRTKLAPIVERVKERIGFGESIAVLAERKPVGRPAPRV